MFKLRESFFVLIILGSLVWVSFWAGAIWRGSTDQDQLALTEGQSVNVDLAPFWKTWKIINEKHVDTRAASSSPITDQEKVWGAIDGLVRSLEDPYSEFLPPADKKQFDQDIQGQFGGVGIELGVRDEALTVISALPDTPARQVGIKSGDKIIQINDKPTSQLSLSEAINNIRGEVDTTLRLKIDRKGEKKPLDFKLVRAIINVPTIETKKLPAGVFLIRLFNFGATAPNLFRSALREFVQSGNDKLIIDLRGNPGGYLDAAVDIASWFLPLGKIVATEDRGREVKPILYQSRGYNIFTDQLALIVLVDGGSASASEILAGALHEYGRARLVGEKTFGKGSVQELIPIAEDSSLKLTVARWLTPRGVSISHNGLEPDVIVKAATSTDPTKTEDDPVLDRAVQLLTK